MAITGRPPAQGRERYRSGRIKPAKPEPPTPNPRVVQIRRALLGAQPGENVDITQAENPVDLAVARGWLDGDLRKAGEFYAALVRELFRLPSMSVTARDGQRSTHNVFADDQGLSKTGVRTKADVQIEYLARQHDQGEITDAEYRRAERAHRAARFNAHGLTDKDLAKLWDAITDAAINGHRADQQRIKELLDAKLGFHKDTSNDNASASARQALNEKVGQFLQIKATLKPDEASEITSLFVTGGWPTWLTLQIFKRPVPREHRQRQFALEGGLRKIADILAPPQPAPDQRLPTKKREEHLTYVDEDGRVLFEVVKIVKIGGC